MTYQPPDPDLFHPLIMNDVKLMDDKIAFLRSQKDTCFLCKWILADWEKNGTLTGHKSGPGSEAAIFPVKGEINHIWLHMYGKSFPGFQNLSEHDQVIHQSTGEGTPEKDPEPPVSHPGGEKPSVAEVSQPNPGDPAPQPPPPEDEVPLSRPNQQ